MKLWKLRLACSSFFISFCCCSYLFCQQCPICQHSIDCFFCYNNLLQMIDDALQHLATSPWQTRRIVLCFGGRRGGVVGDFEGYLPYADNQFQLFIIIGVKPLQKIQSYHDIVEDIDMYLDMYWRVRSYILTLHIVNIWYKVECVCEHD